MAAIAAGEAAAVHCTETLIGILPEKEPFGGGGKDVEATTDLAVESSRALPDEAVTEADRTPPPAPIEKVMTTRPRVPRPSIDWIVARRAASRDWTSEA